MLTAVLLLQMPCIPPINWIGVAAAMLPQDLAASDQLHGFTQQ